MDSLFERRTLTGVLDEDREERDDERDELEEGWKSRSSKSRSRANDI